MALGRHGAYPQQDTIDREKRRNGLMGLCTRFQEHTRAASSNIAPSKGPVERARLDLNQAHNWLVALEEEFDDVES